MGGDGNLSVPLPAPPPPNPAARRQAIDAALGKFDGIEPAPPKKEPSRIRWGAMNRRPAGALIAATLIALIAIPAIRLGLPDRPAEEAAAPEVRNEPAPLAGAPQPAADKATVEAVVPPARSPAAPAATAANEQRVSFAARDEREVQQVPAARMKAAAPPSLAAPAPPPPPPPPPPAQEMAEAEGADSIVVTGSRVQRPNLESASPVTVIGVTSNDFLSSLRAALDSNDRRAVIRLVAIPLRVNFSSGGRTYRSSRDIERDFDRIFTPAVRQAIDNLSPYDLATRDGGRLKGGGRIWFGCGKTLCRDEGAIRVREVVP